MKYFILFIVFVNINFASGKKIIGQIENQLSKLPKTTKAGILILNPLSGDTLYSINHTASMIPASNTKLFTTAAALTLLGADFPISTKLFADNIVIKNGILKGNLYLKGYGNALFSERDLDKLISSLINNGITTIDGDIIGDESFFDDIYLRDDWIQDEVANVKLPPISALVLDRNRTSAVNRRGRKFYVDVKEPSIHVANKLKEKLNSNGIVVKGNTKKGITPISAIEIEDVSIELMDLLKPINKRSDNFLAECLFKIIGAHAYGKQGTAFYATQAVLSFIEDNGIYYRGSSVVDGSGISRYNLITPGAIAGLLERVYFDLNHFDDYFNSLSIAGVDGTLGSRMKRTSAERNFRGKTGTLNGISSLSGYLTNKDGDDIIVVILFEFRQGGANLHRKIQDDIINLLCESGSD